MTNDNLYPPEPPNKDLGFTKQRSENGNKKDTSTLLPHQGVTDCTTLNRSLPQEPKRKIVIRLKKKSNESAIVESQVPVSETISSDKLNTCSQTTQPIESSQTLGLESTSQDVALKPYWNSRVAEMSRRLWLPIETDSVASPLNSLNGSFQRMEQNSWFSIKQWSPLDPMNLPKTSLLSSTSSIVESMEEESTKKTKAKKKPKQTKRTLKSKSKKPPVNSSRVIRLNNLKPEDIQTFQRWFGCYRMTYNMALSALKTNWANTPLNEYWLRDRFVTKKNIPKELNFLLETPKHIREGAIKELVTAYKVNLNKRREDPNFRFNIQFKSKKTKDSTILIPSSGMKIVEDGETAKSIRMYPTILKNFLNYSNKRNKDIEIDRDCRLRMSPIGEFYLHIPMKVSAPDNQGGNKDTVISLDPGVRTFMTGYSPLVKTCYKFADGDIARIQRLCCHLDKLVSKTSKSKGHYNVLPRRRMLRAQYRLRQRIKNLVKEVHYKTISFLLNNFSTIIIPNTPIKEMMKKTKRRINSKTARNMLTWSHYTFRQRLNTKIKNSQHQIIEGGEEYTSKTCSNCGSLHPDLGGKKVFVCKCCNVKMDRDVNGSRGILLKLLSTSVPENS